MTKTEKPGAKPGNVNKNGIGTHLEKRLSRSSKKRGSYSTVLSRLDDVRFTLTPADAD